MNRKKTPPQNYRKSLGRRNCDACSGSGHITTIKIIDGEPYPFADRCTCVATKDRKTASAEKEQQGGLF